MASAQQVKMQVVDCLAAVRTGVGDDAEALGQFAFAQAGGDFQDVSEKFCGGLGGVGEVLPGDDEQVRGSLRVDVGEDEGEVVLVDGLDGDRVAGDLAEETVGHAADSIDNRGVQCS